MPTRLEQLQKLLALDPADTFCTFGIAMEYNKIGQHQAAIEWLDKTIAIDSNYCYAYYQKAKMLLELEKPEDATAVLQTGMAVARKVNDGEARHALSEMQALLDTI